MLINETGSSVRRSSKLLILACAAVALSGAPALAHETDQFTPPPRDEVLVDVGGFLNDFFIDKLEEAVESANKKIGKSVKRKQKIGENADVSNCHKLQTPMGIASAYRKKFGAGASLIERTERKIKHSKQLKKENPDKMLVHAVRGRRSVFSGADFNPISSFTRIWHGGTIHAYGTDLGVDKVGHIVDFGYKMYKGYNKNLKKGMSPNQAFRRAADKQINGAGGESGFYGAAMANVYSNGDLAANYVGGLLFRNLTEPIKLKGQVRPPMLVKDGPYWKVADEVKNDPKYFRWFISDHLNEALNPNIYGKGMRKGIRRNVKKRHENLVYYYGTVRSRPVSKSYFDRLMVELSTYYGDDYGHKGSYNELVSIGGTWPGTP